ncbi:MULTISPECIES: peptidoglycan-binding protein [unclassified Microbacterium]|uniref:peptidoglycan-binding domain-containing protein n=1 Tax=unclassified Microbacterium TaxID=2609290 RepID=UPI0015E2DE3C|nr:MULTISPECIES: peptidoglycan-binding domain-containing protein [unclassified Microbacterium]
MSPVKKVAVALASAFVMVAGSIALAAPASAADAHASIIVKTADCNRSTAFRLTNNANEFATVPTYGTSKSCTLRSGNKNDGVAWLQVALNSCYGKNLATDGDFGPATRNALIQVQQAIGVVADGIYGPNTQSRMKFKNSINYACSPASQISNTVW